MLDTAGNEYGSIFTFTDYTGTLYVTAAFDGQQSFQPFYRESYNGPMRHTHTHTHTYLHTHTPTHLHTHTQRERERERERESHTYRMHWWSLGSVSLQTAGTLEYT